MIIRAALCALLIIVSAPAFGQDESAIGAEFRREREKVRESCGMLDAKAIGSCVFTLATANPLHVTFGSIAPGNGIAVGPAFVGHHTAGESLRMTWSVDAVAASGGSWRAGAYINFVATPTRLPTPSFGDARGTGSASFVYPVYSVFAQTTSLDRLFFFGLGPSPSEAGRSVWSMRQTIVGVNALVPMGPARLGFSVVGGVSGRFIRIGSQSDGATPGIASLYSPITVPGVADDRRFAQFTEGIRLVPTGMARIKPSYRLAFEQFVGGDTVSFNRWSIDLVHEFPFYRTLRPSARDGNTPNDCSQSPSDHSCPAPSRNRYGALAFRAYTVGSQTRSGHVVPFYLQPTLGGSDINGHKALTSFDDYWFRAPNALTLQATVEHALFDIPVGRNITIPLGGFVMAEQGKVANRWGDLFERLAHSYAAGLTVRAGGFPEIYLLYAWGHQGRHFTASINTALLGGSSRPSLH